MALRIDILTLFPEMFPAVLGASIPARAAEAGLVSFHVHDMREWSADKNRRVDDRPFGGGPGMVLMCQPVYDAVLAVEALDPRPPLRILLSPQGLLLNQSLVEQLARGDDPRVALETSRDREGADGNGRLLVESDASASGSAAGSTPPLTAPSHRLLLIAGRYEGLDERVIEELNPLQVSIGDYVLSGGELAAMVLIDAMVRLIPGALGDELSAAQDSFSEVVVPSTTSRDRKGAVTTFPDAAEAASPCAAPTGDDSGVMRLLDCPHYTRPRVWMGREVPAVLLSGDHGAIERWRLERKLERTRARMGDASHSPLVLKRRASG